MSLQADCRYGMVLERVLEKDHMRHVNGPDSGLPEDAARWLAFCRELIKVKSELLAEVEEKMHARVEPPVRG